MIALIAVILGGIFFVSQVVRRATSPIEGQTQVIEQTQGRGNYRIASYEWYFNQCGAIQAAQDRIINQLTELETVDSNSERFATIQTNLLAQRNVRDKLVREYNANARQEETRGQFRDDGLPDEISIDADEENVVDCSD